MEFFSNILLTEGARDRALEMFIPYFQKRGIDMSVSQLKQFLLNKFVTEANIHNLSLGGNYYLLGIARYYFNGNITSNKQLNALYPRVRDRFIPEVCERLDALINILRNAYIDSVGTKWEQPEDFGSLPLDKLLRKYNSKINKALGLDTKPETPAVVEKPEVSNDYTAGKDYTYEIMYSYQDCKKFNGATSPGAWCITYGQQHYDNYVRMFKRYGGIHYVVFKQNGYENIPRQRTAGFTKKKPHDAYGNSLICVLQRNDCSEPTYITSRWNHGAVADGTAGIEADHAYTKEEFLQVIGCDQSVLDRAYNQWKANTEGDREAEKNEKLAARAEGRTEKLTILRALKYMQMLINGGANPLMINQDERRMELPGFSISFRPFGWNPKEWREKNGYEEITPNNAPQKYGYIVMITQSNEEGLHGKTYFTVMDRKQLMFDQFFEEWFYGSPVEATTDTYMRIVSRQGSDNFSAFYDRKRHRFLDVDGVRKFKYISDNIKYNDDPQARYAIVGVSGNQLALLDLHRMTALKAGNGAGPWFEAILPFNTWSNSNTDHRGHISLSDYDLGGGIERSVLKLIYDSSADMVYYYNTETNVFVDLRAGLPDGWHINLRNRTPGKRYVTYVDREVSDYPQRGAVFMFRNLDNGELYSVNGISKFHDYNKRGNVVEYMPIGSDTIYYYDDNLNKQLEINGKPVTNVYECDSVSPFNYYKPNEDFIRISLTRFVPDKDGRYRYGNSNDKCLLYNPIIGEFYHDDISGYVFKLWSDEYAYKPEAIELGLNWRTLGDSEERNKYLYKLPKAKDVVTAQTVRTENYNIIGNILREEIEKFIKNIK